MYRIELFVLFVILELLLLEKFIILWGIVDYFNVNY